MQTNDSITKLSFVSARGKLQAELGLIWFDLDRPGTSAIPSGSKRFGLKSGLAWNCRSVWPDLEAKRACKGHSAPPTTRNETAPPTLWIYSSQTAAQTRAKASKHGRKPEVKAVAPQEATAPRRGTTISATFSPVRRHPPLPSPILPL